MKITAEIDGHHYSVDLSAGRSIAITMNFDGPQPNHFGVEQARSGTVEIGDFVGDTQRGGSCNVRQLSLIPHCNGTHTESVWHIVNESVPVAGLARPAWFVAELLSVAPVPARDTGESYRPELDHHDTLLTRTALQQAAGDVNWASVSALIVRTLPNSADKKSIAWGHPLHPAFLTIEAMQWIVDLGIEHLLLDLPSVDKMYDEGLLTNHHIFWNVPAGTHALTDPKAAEKTITEMVFVDDDLPDGRYLLNLQFADLNSDAAPARPLLFRLTRQGR